MTDSGSPGPCLQEATHEPALGTVTVPGTGAPTLVPAPLCPLPSAPRHALSTCTKRFTVPSTIHSPSMWNALLVLSSNSPHPSGLWRQSRHL